MKMKRKFHVYIEKKDGYNIYWLKMIKINLLLAILFLSSCNTLHKITGHKEKINNIEPIVKVSGVASSNNENVGIRVYGSLVSVRVLRPCETEWVSLKHDEFRLNESSVTFLYKEDIKYPLYPVVPIGSKYEVTSEPIDFSNRIY